MTVFEYIIFERLVQANRLLQNPSQTVAETAALMHYDDVSYFSRQFKKAFGISPNEYRKKYL
jgi:two-component system response regulator YesN